MKNLINQIQLDADKKIAEFLKGLKAEKTIESILKQWHYTDLIPKSNNKTFTNIKELKDYLTKRKLKLVQKELQQKLERIATVEAAETVNSISIGVEWKKAACGARIQQQQ